MTTSPWRKWTVTVRVTMSSLETFAVQKIEEGDHRGEPYRVVRVGDGYGANGYLRRSNTNPPVADVQYLVGARTTEEAMEQAIFKAKGTERNLAELNTPRAH